MRNSSGHQDSIDQIIVEHLDWMRANLEDLLTNSGLVEADLQGWVGQNLDRGLRCNSHHHHIHRRSNFDYYHHFYLVVLSTIYDWVHLVQTLRRGLLEQKPRAMALKRARKSGRMVACYSVVDPWLVLAAYASERGPAVALQLVEASVDFTSIYIVPPFFNNRNHRSAYFSTMVFEVRTSKEWRWLELLCHVRDLFLYQLGQPTDKPSLTPPKFFDPSSDP